MNRIHLNYSHTFGDLENHLSKVIKDELVLILLDIIGDENGALNKLEDEFQKLNTDLLFALQTLLSNLSHIFRLFSK